MDKQCSSCGGFCKKSGCERENVHEPVAWMDKETNLLRLNNRKGSDFDIDDWTPLYTTPPQSFTYEQVKAHIQVALLSSQPQRTWVDLTDEEVEEIERWVEFKEEGSGRIPMGKLVSYISEKLRNKNT